MEVWPIGCASICLRSGRSHEYILIPISLFNKGCHMQWFYLQDVSQGFLLGPQLLGVNLGVPSEAPINWSRDVTPEEKV
jgi:hypothetical protein